MVSRTRRSQRSGTLLSPSAAPEIAPVIDAIVSVSPPKKIAVPLPDADPAEFWTGDFAKEKAPASEYLRLHWAWGAAGSWEAPDYPRFTFRGQPALFKLYVLSSPSVGSAGPGPDPAEKFLQQLLPEMGKVLFSNHMP